MRSMTILNTAAIFLLIACLAAAALHLFTVGRGKIGLAGIAKATASTAFVLLAATNGAVGTTYGRLILAAFVLSWIGDILLISDRARFFIAGLGAFLLAHVCFGMAFAFRAINFVWLTAALIITAGAGLALYRWLEPRLNGIFALAVPAYIAVIMVMVSLAIAASAAGMTWTVGAGAIIFAVSDVFVARERFVGHGFVNKLCGIPLYYIAQLLLAVSVMTVQS
jgi:uncharacterized membrane protein YhhN